MRSNYSLVHYEADSNGSVTNILNYFDKVFDHYKESARVYNEGDYSYSAPLVSSLKPLEKGDLTPVDMGGFWEKELKTYPSNILEEIKKNPKYAECFE